jgi:uncharacterized protein (DUF4415 family)
VFERKFFFAIALFTTHINERERRELRALSKMRDSQIDLSDAPERLAQRSNIQRGRFYKPVKQLVSLRVDREMESQPRGR